MNAREYLIEQATKRIDAQLKNSVVVWNNDEILAILKSTTDKQLINKMIILSNKYNNIRLEILK